MLKQMVKKAVHPGEVLRERFMVEFGLNINRIARDLRVPVTRVAEIVNECRAVTPDMALRLARYLGTTAEYWMNLQTDHALELARVDLADIERDVRPLKAA
jgi:addiction module HigA family antidote